MPVSLVFVSAVNSRRQSHRGTRTARIGSLKPIQRAIGSSSPIARLHFTAIQGALPGIAANGSYDCSCC